MYAVSNGTTSAQLWLQGYASLARAKSAVAYWAAKKDLTVTWSDHHVLGLTGSNGTTTDPDVQYLIVPLAILGDTDPDE